MEHTHMSETETALPEICQNSISKKRLSINDTPLHGCIAAFWTARLAMYQATERGMAAACRRELRALDKVLAFAPRTLTGLASQTSVFRACVEDGDGNEDRADRMAGNILTTLRWHGAEWRR
jgi:hypothetical protein